MLLLYIFLLHMCLASITDWKRRIAFLSGIKVIHHLVLVYLLLMHMWVKYLVHFVGLLRLKLLLDLLVVLEVLGTRQLGIFWLILLNESNLALKDFAWVLLMHLVLVSRHFDGRSQLL